VVYKSKRLESKLTHLTKIRRNPHKMLEISSKDCSCLSSPDLNSENTLLLWCYSVLSETEAAPSEWSLLFSLTSPLWLVPVVSPRISSIPRSIDDYALLPLFNNSHPSHLQAQSTHQYQYQAFHLRQFRSLIYPRASLFYSDTRIARSVSITSSSVDDSRCRDGGLPEMVSS
jgi:hypothetical protein